MSPHDPSALAAAAGPDTVLTCTAGVAVHISRAGAIVRRCLVPGADGRVEDVILGYDETLPYLVRVGVREWRARVRKKRRPHASRHPPPLARSHFFSNLYP